MQELADAGDEADHFSITLPFAGSECGECGDLGEEGECASCGGHVPAPTGDATLVSARIAALTPILRQIHELESELRIVRPGSTPVSSDQFNAIVLELDVYDRMISVIGLARSVQDLDFEKRASVGGSTRKAIAGFIPQLRELVEAAREVASFAPEGPALRLRAATAEGIEWAIGAVRATIETLVAASPSEAREASRVMQGYLDGSPAVREVDTVFPEIVAAARLDTDSRLELVLGRPGPFTDDVGFIDFARVFGAFSKDTNPLESLDSVTRSYFADQLPERPAPGTALLLALPMAGLASLDRPLVGHRTLRGTVRALEVAWAADESETLKVLQGTGKEAALVIGGLSRAVNGLRLLAYAEREGWVDDGNALMQVMNAYRELVEAPFRTYAWMAYRLRAIAVGRTENSQAPMSSELVDRLNASGDDYLRGLARCLEPGIRNAASHSQYRWVRERAEVEDLRTGERWTLDQLTKAVDDLAGSVLGLDAGTACFAVREGVASQLEDTSTYDDVASLLATIVEALFAAQGYRVLAVDEAMRDITLDVNEVSLMKAIPVLGGIATLDWLENERLTLYGPDGDSIASIDVTALRRAGDASTDLRDIEIARICRRVETRPRTDTEFAALLVAIVVVPALLEASSGEVPGGYLHRNIIRLEHIREIRAVQASGALPDITRAISAAYQLRAGKKNMARTFATRLNRLLNWSLGHDLRDFG